MINYKVELKLKWTKYCVLSVHGNYDADTNSNIIITIESYQNFLANDLKDMCIEMNIKQKVGMKI